MLIRLITLINRVRRHFQAGGIFSSNPIYARLDSDIRIYSQKELERLRRNVALEISEIMDMSNTPELTKRLDDLLHSPFVNYEPRYIDNLFSLADKITFLNI